MKVSAFGLTDVGCRRQNNEDAFLVREDLNLYIVADGVGGAAAGEIASGIFTKSGEKEFEADSGWNQDYGMLLTRCFKNANQAILDHTQQHSETRGMGCTAEALTFHNDHYFIGHVGDSRTYLLRNNTIQQLTKDHSFIQEQLDLGLVTEEEAETHWLRNAIYRALGHRDDVEVDLISDRVQDGDRFLLCSDGLTDMLEDQRILEISTTQMPLVWRVQKLISEAKENGGIDNITVVICDIAIEPPRNLLSSIKKKLLKSSQN